MSISARQVIVIQHSLLVGYSGRWFLSALRTFELLYHWWDILLKECILDKFFHRCLYLFPVKIIIPLSLSQYSFFSEPQFSRRNKQKKLSRRVCRFCSLRSCCGRIGEQEQRPQTATDPLRGPCCGGGIM